MQLLALVGPVVAWAAALWRQGERDYRRTFLRRVVDVRRFGPVTWPAVAGVGAGPALAGAATAAQGSGLELSLALWAVAGILAWLVSSTRGVIAAAVLAHALGNVTGELLATGPAADLWQLAVTTIAALAVLAAWHRGRQPAT